MSSFTGTAQPKKKLAPVQVFLRIRPKHVEDGCLAISHCTPKEIQMKGHMKSYSFDQIFDEKTSQVKVYKTVVGKMITDVTKGYNCTIFAYGQTGTGKTHTIIGDDSIKDVETQNWQEESGAGIILRAAMHLYEELNKVDPNIQKTVTVSFMEIYNEEIRDLLCDKELIPLRIYEDKMKSIHVKNLQEVTVLDPSDIIKLLKKGCERRQVASTLMNNRSSRSHTVFTISVSTMQTISVVDNISNITCGKLNLIDLAGSENIAKSGSKEQRAREATNINQSLLTLGRVIKALVENSSHVPYRESKLTRILQDSLGGHAKTSIIATVSPGMASLEETMNTLDYAHNARHITNCPTINLRTSAAAAAVQEELQRLKRDLFATANEQGVYMDKENYDEMTQSLTQYKKEIANKHERIRSLLEQVEQYEAEKNEWENLKESFNKTSQAYQMVKTEIGQKEEELRRASELYEYYKSESSKLQEFADLMLTRENHLHKKLDFVHASSSKNQNAIENIIETVENTVYSLFHHDDSDSISKNIAALIQFNEKVCHMVDNVANQLEERSHNIEKIQKTDECTNECDNCTNSGDFHESLEYLKNKFITLSETCSTRISDLHEWIEMNKNYVTEIRESHQEAEERHRHMESLLDKETKNYNLFEKNLSQVVSTQNTSILEYLEERQKCIEREQHMVKELKEMIKKDEIEKEKAKYREERDMIYKGISNVQHAEKIALQKIHSITDDTLRSLDSGHCNPNDVKNYVQNIKDEVIKVLDNVLTDYRQQNSEMASVLQQISHILNIEGKSNIQVVTGTLYRNIQELVDKVKGRYETSVVPITHAGDTPKPLEGTQNILRNKRNSMVKNLFHRNMPEDHGESQ